MVNVLGGKCSEGGKCPEGGKCSRMVNLLNVLGGMVNVLEW